MSVMSIVSGMSSCQRQLLLSVTLSSGCLPKYAVLWFRVLSRDLKVGRQSLFPTRDIIQVSHLEFMYVYIYIYIYIYIFVIICDYLCVFLNETACYGMSPSESCHLTWCGYKGLAKPIDASQSSANGQTCRKNLNAR